MLWRTARQPASVRFHLWAEVGLWRASFSLLLGLLGWIPNIIHSSKRRAASPLEVLWVNGKLWDMYSATHSETLNKIPVTLKNESHRKTHHLRVGFSQGRRLGSRWYLRPLPTQAILWFCDIWERAETQMQTQLSYLISKLFILKPT